MARKKRRLPDSWLSQALWVDGDETWSRHTFDRDDECQDDMDSDGWPQGVDVSPEIDWDSEEQLRRVIEEMLMRKRVLRTQLDDLAARLFEFVNDVVRQCPEIRDYEVTEYDFPYVFGTEFVLSYVRIKY